jgi:hypothetical protein
MNKEKTGSKINGRPAAAPGTVIQLRLEQPPRPRVSAFIWGGKVRPVPMLPYGRRSA